MELIKQIDENFNFNNNIIRIVGTYDEPWFVAKDICQILEIRDVSMALTKIPEKWKGTKVIGTLGGKQDMRIINEAGLYKLIMRSNKTIAEKFQEVVCEDILPTLRKKGEYKIQSIIYRNKELEEEKLKIEEEKKELEEEKLRIEEDNKRLEEEKNKKEEELTKLTRKYVKPPKEVIDGMNFVYLITSEEKEESGEFVIGKSLSLTNRKEDYNQEKLHNHKIIYYRSFKSSKIMDIAESLILSKFGKYRCKAGRDVFQLPEFANISLFTDLFDKCFDILEDIEEEHVIFPKRTYTSDDTKKWNTTRKDVIENYSEEKKEELKEKTKEYRALNKDIINEISRVKNALNPEINAEKCKKYYEKNKEDILEERKEYYKDNKEDILEERKDYYKDNKEYILEERKEYYKDNYKTKIATQRQQKETCECGMIVSHYCMNRHKKSDRHRMIMKTLMKNDGFAKIVILEEESLSVAAPAPIT